LLPREATELRVLGEQKGTPCLLAVPPSYLSRINPPLVPGSTLDRVIVHSFFPTT